MFILWTININIVKISHNFIQIKKYSEEKVIIIFCFVSVGYFEDLCICPDKNREKLKMNLKKNDYNWNIYLIIAYAYIFTYASAWI